MYTYETNQHQSAKQLAAIRTSAYKTYLAKCLYLTILASQPTLQTAQKWNEFK